MYVEKLAFEGFRNLENGFIEPNSGVNIIYGDNAQGKTNLLETIWLFTGSKSFRGSRDSELINFNSNYARLKLDFYGWERSQNSEIIYNETKSVKINGIDEPASRLAGRFCAMVFSPAHLSLIKDGPEGRRRFIDSAYCQIRPAYIKILSEFNRALLQRNTLLKQIKKSRVRDTSQLFIWDDKVARTGAQVVFARSAYVRNIAPAAKKIYEGFSGSSASYEELSLEYLSFFDHLDDIDYDKFAYHEKQIYQELLQLISNNYDNDIAAGFTTVGPHRDDLDIRINGLSAKSFGSQGQQRSAVLALKLAEASIIKKITDQQPVALLDDVMSELDVKRQDFVLNHIEGWQVFITCCDPSPIMRLSKGSTFLVESGKVTTDGRIS